MCYVYASGYNLISNSYYVRTAERKCFDQLPSQGLSLFNGIHIMKIIIQFVFYYKFNIGTLVMQCGLFV